VLLGMKHGIKVMREANGRRDRQLVVDRRLNAPMATSVYAAAGRRHLVDEVCRG
jgi:hypothetical protein